MENNRPQAYIFDFDGVILDSAQVKTWAFGQLFNDYPEHQEAVVNYHLAHQGISRYAKIEWAYQELLKQPLTTREKKERGSRFSKLVLDKVIASDFILGAEELLDWLALNRIPAFIATGTPQSEIEIILQKRGLDKYFKDVWGSPTEKPEIIKTLLRKYSFPPENVVFLGDAASDHRAALATKVPFVAVASASSRAYWEEQGIVPIDRLDRIIK